MKVHELLNAPEKWTKLAFARRADSLSCGVRGEEARAWCLWGAVDKCYDDAAAYLDVRNRIYDAIGTSDLALWNDMPSRTFEQVRALALELDI